MKRLTVLYDERCAFCVRCQQWLATQPAYVPLQLLPCRGAEARRRYGELAGGGDELLVVADDGAYYRGAKAFLVCLHALRRYRPLARRLASPALLPFARQALDLVSMHRLALGRLMGLSDPAALGKKLAQLPPPSCAVPSARVLHEARRES